MSDLLFSVLRLPLAASALFVSPWLAACLVLPRQALQVRLAAAGAASMAFNTVVPVALHLAGLPIDASALALVHGGCLAVLAAATAARRRLAPTPRTPGADVRRALAAAAGLALLLFPVTPLAGIDTYKWQDLATSVRVEACIPWLSQPLALLGFGPRAYPSAQPLMLATAQILGGVGVEAGFYLVSLLTALTAFFAADVFGTRLGGPAHGRWFALLYVLSPVFVRYAHWATGRGFFLAVYPLLPAALCTPFGARSLAAVPLALLLLLTHKTALVAVPLCLLSLPLSLLVPRSRIVPAAGAAAACAAGLALSRRAWLPGPAGLAAGFAWAGLTRFGPLLPLAALACARTAAALQSRPARRWLPAVALSLPLAFTADMYGAMAALPFVVLLAAPALSRAAERRDRLARVVPAAAVALSLACALAIVISRSVDATPRSVRAAALFLERYDPAGPFMVHGPGRTGAQVQAYVSGCPRFTLGREPRAVAPTAPPPLSGAPREVVARWTGWLRHAVAVEEKDDAWYGLDPRHYYMVVGEDGERPAAAVTLYDRGGVKVLAPEGQPELRGAPALEVDRAPTPGRESAP